MYKYRRYYIAAIVFSSLGWLSNFSILIIVKNLIDGLFAGTPVEISGVVGDFVALFGGKNFLVGHLWIATLAVLFFRCLVAFFGHLTIRFSGIACHRIIRILRNRLYAKFQELSDSFFSRSETGDLIQRSTADIGKVQSFLSNQLLTSGRQVVMLVVLIPFMFVLDAKMAALSLFAIPITVVLVYVYVRLVIRISIDVEDKEAKLTTAVQENLTGIRVVRAFARQTFERDKLVRRSLMYHDLAMYRYRKSADLHALSSLLAYTQTGIILIGGGWMVTNSQVSLGTLVVFLAYSHMMVWTIRDFGTEIAEIGGFVVAISRIDEILHENETIDHKNLTEDFALDGDIQFDNVGFSYNGSDRVLKNVSFGIKPGETVAIVGPSGSGKSTVIKLLLKSYHCQEGKILLDGKDLKDLDAQTVRSQIGSSLQEPFLFSTTIKSNIKIAKDGTTDEEMTDAAKTAHLDDTIRGFADSYDSEVGEKGAILSGGQRQRVAAARAFVKRPPILMLDDSLSAVDTRTEREIVRALESKHKDATTLLITHRLSCCINMDRILVLENGELVAQGTHNQLIEEEGFYKRLWEIQKGIEKEAYRINANG
ncbi:MAG: ABC transporter ATP-binding protein [Proteobacteria bacterium]|nr:ABC transporter ATP-binding protein [Pseudomonadota bacterium]